MNTEQITPRYGVEYENSQWQAVVDERHSVYYVGEPQQTFRAAWAIAQQQRMYDARPVAHTTGYALEAS